MNNIIREVKGNLITLAEIGEFDVIVHGCNSFCKFGIGLAKEIKCKYPQAYEADLKTAYGDVNKLGNYSFVKVKSRKRDIYFYIINAYIQYYYGYNKDNVNYNAIRNVFKRISENFNTFKIGIPMIGSGYAGGDWIRISSIIREELKNVNYTLVKYE